MSTTTDNTFIVTVTPQQKGKQTKISISKAKNGNETKKQQKQQREQKQAPVTAKRPPTKKQLVRKQRRKQNKWLNKVLPQIDNDDQRDDLLAQIMSDKARIKKTSTKHMTTYRLIKMPRHPKNKASHDDDDNEDFESMPSSPPPLQHESPLYHFAPPTFVLPPPQQQQQLPQFSWSSLL